MKLTFLERDMYTEAAAARLLRVPPSTLHYWLEGGVYRRKRYAPVIRLEPTGERQVTWGEFIEAGLLAQYRRRQVPLGELRVAIDQLRDESGLRYPLADRELYIGSGRKLLQRAQEDAGLKSDFSLVAVASGQLVLTPASNAFFERVEWEEALPGGWRPHDDPASPVRMWPRQRFGLPAIGGIRTEVIWEHLEAEETPEGIAETFGLSLDDVEWARSYEHATRSARSPRAA